MNIQRLKEIEALNLSPAEALEYGFIKSDSLTILHALHEHGLKTPEDALTFAIPRLTQNSLTYLLKPYGYQPIPKRKQAKREAALSH